MMKTIYLMLITLLLSVVTYGQTIDTVYVKNFKFQFNEKDRDTIRLIHFPGRTVEINLPANEVIVITIGIIPKRMYVIYNNGRREDYCLINKKE